MDKHYFELSKNNTLIDSIEEKSQDRKLGGDIIDTDDKIRIYIGTNPLLINIRNFIIGSNKVIPKEFELYSSYDVYILSHSIGIIKEGGWEKINQVGYRMEFSSNDQAVVLDLLPQSKFIKKVGVNLEIEATLGLNGNLSIPTNMTKLLDNVEWLGIGSKLQASTNNSIVGNISFSIYSNEITAIGKNGNYSEWLFNHTDLPLSGKDLEMSQILLIDRFASNISYKCKAYVNISSWLGYNTVRRETDWITIEHKLK